MSRSVQISTVMMWGETARASEKATETLSALCPLLKQPNFSADLKKKIDHFFENEKCDMALAKLYYEDDFKMLYLNMARVNYDGNINSLRNIFAWKLS